MIFVGSIVIHKLSGLYFKCENNKQARWMNMNPYYELVDPRIIPQGYFDKAL